MMVYGLLGITILFAFLSIFFAWRGTTKPVGQGWHLLLLAVSIAVFIYLYGTWVFLSVYARYVFGIVFISIFILRVFGFGKKNKLPVKSGKIVPVLFAIIFIGFAVLYFTGTRREIEKAALRFPLKKGSYFVLQGGKGLPANFFHYAYRGAVFAIDLVKLNKYGNRANAIFSKRLEDYEIFNDTVYSPCRGRVIRMRDENPDNIPSVRKRGPSNINQVLIETDSFYVFLGHLKQNEVYVKEGDFVEIGQVLGLVGNSGFSLEPHLHIQVHKNSHSGLNWYQEEPLYIEFDGRSYLLFEMIRPKRVKMVEP